MRVGHGLFQIEWLLKEPFVVKEVCLLDSILESRTVVPTGLACFLDLCEESLQLVHEKLKA